MRRTFIPAALAIALVGTALVLTGCSTAPKSREGRSDLREAVESTRERLFLKYPGLEDSVDRAHGHVLFPTVGKGGLIVGGAYGRGEVYEGDTLVGYADISQATVGAQIGGQSFAELILFEDRNALEEFKRGEFAFSANASAVALKSGEAVAADYEDGVAVFIEPQGGLMAEASIGGQSFSFQPK